MGSTSAAFGRLTGYAQVLYVIAQCDAEGNGSGFLQLNEQPAQAADTNG